MTRKDFLAQLGIGAAFVLTTSCLQSCKKDAAVTNLDITVDLTTAAYDKLKTNGGYVVKDNVVIARTKSGEYVAATLICSHEDLKQITFQDEEWNCTAHGARFDQKGVGLNGNGKKGLTIYKTTLTGTNLRVFS